MWVPFYWFAAASLATTPGYADGVSGAYVGSGSNSAFLVEIVETPGGQLTGRYEQTALQPDGKIVQTTASITGASDGQTIVVTIKPSTDQLFASNITASGTLQGAMLHLSGAGGDGSKIDLNLAKSNEAAYRKLLMDITVQSQAMISVRVRADQIAHLNDLAAKMIASSVNADAQLGKFPPIERRYRAITELMNAALTRQKSIYGDGSAYIARGQVGVAINQAGGEAEQLHAGVQSSKEDIESKVQNLAKNVSEASKACQADNRDKDEFSRLACANFQDASIKFKASIAALSQAFDRTETVWTEEHQKQEEIIRASDVASR